jgi:cellobionic acid phosphorylase
LVHPTFPSNWKDASVTRYFRGANIHVEFRRDPEARETTVLCEGKPLIGGVLTDIIAGKDYQLSVKLPLSESKLNPR